MELWARGSATPAIAFGCPWQRYAFRTASSGAVTLSWVRDGNAPPQSVFTPLASASLRIALDAATVAELSLGCEPDPAAEPVPPPVRPPGWTARFASLGSVSLRWRDARGDSVIELRAPPESCAAVARWLRSAGAFVPGLRTSLAAAIEGSDAISAAFLGLDLAASPEESERESKEASGADIVSPVVSGAADLLAPVASAIAAASPALASLGSKSLIGVKGRVVIALPTYMYLLSVAGAASNVLGKVLEVAGEVPCIGGLARVLLLLRDGVAAVQARPSRGWQLAAGSTSLPFFPCKQAHASDVSEFEAVLQLYARALADTAAGVAKGGGAASETLQGVCDSLREELRTEMRAKAADLDAATASKDRGGLRKAWAVVVGSLRDSVFRGEESRLSAVTSRLRARLPELCAALQVRWAVKGD